MKSDPIEVLYGMYLMEGVRDALDDDTYFELHDRLGVGNLELTLELTRHVPYLMEKEATLPEGPGIYLYEVVSLFGSFWAGTCDMNESFPSEQICHAAIDRLFEDFIHNYRTEPNKCH